MMKIRGATGVGAGGGGGGEGGGRKCRVFPNDILYIETESASRQ